MKRCDICSDPFKNAHGVSVHKLRSACGSNGAAWEAGKKTRAKAKTKRRRQNGESGREAIRRILADHPEGLPVAQIFDTLQASGQDIKQHRVSQIATTDSSLKRIARGVYKLKKKARPSAGLTAAAGTAVVKEAMEEAATTVELSKQTLLLRIDHLVVQNQALQNSNQALLRGMMA